MGEFQPADLGYGPILSLVSKDRYTRGPKIPVEVMDEQTHNLIQINDLYGAVDFTKTQLGALSLYRSLRQPLTDVVLINAKQRSLEELRGNPVLRDRISGVIGDVAKDEESLLHYYKKDYVNSWIGTPNLYDAFKGSNRVFLRLMDELAGMKAETAYLNTLMQNFTSLKEDDVAKFIRGSVSRTPLGLRAGKDKKFWIPGLTFKATDFKPVRWVIQGGPLAAVFGLMFSGDQNLMNLSVLVMLGWGSSFFPITAQTLGRKFDDKLFTKPISEMYFANPRVINAIESIGRLDELLSLADYADCLQVPVVLPEIEDALRHHFEARDLRNPVLTKGNPDYVGNGVNLNGGLTFLTGPNSGGKTCLSKTILQAQVLTQIGSYIPAQKAKMSVADGIYYHSPMVNSLQDEEGRFGVEIARARDIFFKTTPRSLVVLDELIEATTYEEKIKNSREIMEDFWAIGGNTILVTHNHELVESFRDQGLGQTWQVEFDGDRPTHKIIPGISTDSHADKVMERVGFTRKDRQRYLREKGYN